MKEVLADGFAVVHGVESGDLVNTHRGHLEHTSDFIHDAYAGEAVLTLAQIQQRHDGGLLVLWWVALKDLIDECEVLVGELERDGGVVVRAVAVLFDSKFSVY